ncbi:hypothetical protein [Streptomyces sp. NPDC059009]|uniref:hypothetical protein n=1 Tax=Streptomyces sp. NPDC059009 TaxID=3346694 RepID=UPI00367C87FC
MTETVVPEAYQGYPGVAFGGYVAGLLAGRSAARTVRVDFRAVTPVGIPVELAEVPGGGARLLDKEGATLATATPAADLSGPVPDVPSWAEAVAAAEEYRAHPPTGLVDEQLDCFGCGLDRTPDRGLRQHCSLVPGRGLVATAWTPHPVFADGNGELTTEVLWAALDCPSAWAGVLAGRLGKGAVTAALTATALRPVTTGEGHITFAWPVAHSGRKHTTGVAIATAAGELCVVGEALWVEPRS